MSTNPNPAHGASVGDYTSVGSLDANAKPQTDVQAGAGAEAEAEERGRMKERQSQSSRSPARAVSPSRGHERDSATRHRHHHRLHERPASPGSSMTPPAARQEMGKTKKKQRRSSDAEADHTFRGRGRKRSGSRGRSRSPVIDEESDASARAAETKAFRRRSRPPSGHREHDGRQAHEQRRQRSYPNLYQTDGGGAERGGAERKSAQVAVGQESGESPMLTQQPT
jgi:hypothetical protein